MNDNMNKSILRQSFRAKRAAFGEELINTASEAACRNIEKLKEFSGADTVLLYYPIKNEISPLPLLEIAKAGKKQIAFPVCEDNGTLTFRAVSTLNELKKSKFGLLEPAKEAKIAEITEKTLCIVPALAFSSDGYRLGYGKGFYDKFLQDFAGISAGICYSQLVLDTLPTESHDKRVDILITESEVLYIAKKD